MGERIPINFYSRRSDSRQSDRHYLHGKQSRIFDFVNDGTGVIDVYTDDAMEQAVSSQKDKYRLLWITESRAYRENLFTKLRDKRYTERFFSTLKLDNIITYEEDMKSVDNRFIFMKGCGHWIKYPAIYEKSKLCSMITSKKELTKLQMKRVQIAKRAEVMGVDVFGRGFNEISEKEDGLCNYMYSIAIENIETETYFTEKLLDCFATGTVPIYIGAKKISKFFDDKGIIKAENGIDLSLLSKEDYESRIDAIKNNLILSMQYEFPLEEILLKIIGNLKSTRRGINELQRLGTDEV